VNDPTTVLYVLTTLAQSCGALAAFVGAVGVFRLQMLREQRKGVERELRCKRWWRLTLSSLEEKTGARVS
jgi:hypothetical protein